MSNIKRKLIKHLLITALQKNKIFSNKFTKKKCKTYTLNYKTSLKEIKEDLNKGEHFQCL